MADSGPTSAIRRPKILIVDDVKANLVALKRLLSKVEAEVIAANSGNEALALSLEHEFALVLLDVQMPDLDGYEVAELLRSEEMDRTVPIIFVTAARKEEQHRLRGYGIGAVDYIEKPIDDVALLSKAQVFIDLYNSRCALQQANQELAAEVVKRKTREQDNQRLAGTIFDASAEAIVVTDASNSFVAVNPAFTRVTGYQPAEVIGSNPSILQSGNHDHGFYADMWDTLLATGLWKGEIWNKRKNGEIYPQELSISAVRGAEGRIANYVGIFRDISERKRIESDLRDAKLAAESANVAKSVFLANMSHELRTPLTAILGFSELIEAQVLGPISQPQYIGYAADVRSSGQHLLTLINDVLDISKIEARKWVLALVAIDIAEVINQCLKLVAVRAEEAGIDLRVASAPNLPPLIADLRAVKQCLINLLSNAVKFTPHGGTVTISTCFQEGMLLVSVADTGIGIPAEEIPRLMHPFEQVENIHTRKHTTSGTGLGLALTKALVEMHTGQIQLVSEVDKGTTVTLCLPLNGPAAVGTVK